MEIFENPIIHGMMIISDKLDEDQYYTKIKYQ